METSATQIRVQTTQYHQTSTRQNTNQSSKSFEETLDASSKKEESNPAVEKFLEDLLEKGAANFLAELNEEKIQKLVEEFRQKLIEKMGSDSDTLKEIDSLVADFKKQLLEKLENSLDNDDSSFKVSSLAMAKILLQMDAPKNSSLEKLLQES